MNDVLLSDRVMLIRQRKPDFDGLFRLLLAPCSLISIGQKFQSLCTRQLSRLARRGVLQINDLFGRLT